MNKDLINKLIVVASVTIAIAVLYYLISPYQNCMKSLKDKEITITSEHGFKHQKDKAEYCRENTDW